MASHRFLFREKKQLYFFAFIALKHAYYIVTIEIN